MVEAPLSSKTVLEEFIAATFLTVTVERGKEEQFGRLDKRLHSYKLRKSRS